MKKLPRKLVAMSMAALITCSVASMASAETLETRTTAIHHNFISNLWDLSGDNGLPSFEKYPQPRAISVGMDVDGNAIQTIDEQDIRYFNGKYYMYGKSPAYGAFHHNPFVDASPVVETATGDSYYRYGGLAIYSSDDMMNWKLEDNVFFTDDEGQMYLMKKPRVVYSEKTGLYTMWFLVVDNQAIRDEWSEIDYTTEMTEVQKNAGGFNFNNQFRYVQSKTPVGPWGEVHTPSCETDLFLPGADYELVVDEDGNGYAAVSHNGIRVLKLNEEMTGTLDQTVITIQEGTLAGGIGIHHHGDWWYLTGSKRCGNCASVPMYYVMAKDPLGPWISPVSGEAEEVLTPGIVAENVEFAQVHSAKNLPGMDGKLNAVIPATHYRTSPSGCSPTDGMAIFGDPGDNNLALAGLYLLTLEYDEEGHILPLNLEDDVEIPLAHEVTTSVPTAYEAQLVINNERSVSQSWVIPEGETLAAVMPSVFQRTPDKGRDIIAQEPLVNAPLYAVLELPNGTIYDWTIDARTVRWSPAAVALNLPEAYTEGGRVTLTLTTKATNGGYGVAVCKKSEDAMQTEYTTVTNGEAVVRDQVEMLIQTSDKKLAAPEITVQPRSVQVREGWNTSFFVKAKGVGLGYQWTKDGKVMFAPDGYNESNAPAFRFESVTAEDEGTYVVYVFNQAGSVVSVPVTLEVIPADAETAEAEAPVAGEVNPVAETTEDCGC